MRTSIDILNESLSFLDSMSVEQFQEYEKSLNLDPLDMSIYEDNSGIEIISYADNCDFDFSIDITLNDFNKLEMKNSCIDGYLAGYYEDCIVPAA